ncbi:MAG: flagellar hook-length control protein FliK [Armatimonadota bacterium]|nr:flagellar hook-length control protein FliK [Armatimonadota bacterium]
MPGAPEPSRDGRPDLAHDAISRTPTSHRGAGREPAPQVEAVRIPRIPETARGLAKSLRDDGPQRVRIEVHPPELGRCELELSMREGAVRAVIVADRPETAAAMRSAEAQVREALARQDLQMAEFDVREGGAGDARHAPQDRPEARQAPLPRMLRRERLARDVWRPAVTSAARRVNLVA